MKAKEYYIESISELLESADERKLRLILVYVQALLGK